MAVVPSGANANLSANQQKFLSGFVQATGLNPTVAAAWLRNEEPKLDTNTDPQGHGAYNFLNIGITDSGAHSANYQAWRDPLQAGIASGQWLAGKLSIPGYGHSAASIQGITRTAGQSPAAQIAAIQHSGWASGGETALPGLYQQFSGQGGITPTQAYRSTVAAPGQLTTAAANVPKQIAGLQPAAQTQLDTDRNSILQWATAQANQINQVKKFAGAGGVAQTPIGQQTSGFIQSQPFQTTSNEVPSLMSLVGTSQVASASGKSQTATALTNPVNGKKIPVQIDPGVNADKATAGAIKLAKQYLGTAYHFGGASPQSGFDCSGLIKYVYGKMGIDLPHYTGDMLKVGQSIDPTNTAALKPGDALFFNGGEHVGMYLGDGQFIQAPHTGDVVKISNLQGYDGGIYAVRRYA